jgi:3-hydroxyisobutyrate dehydrogenase
MTHIAFIGLGNMGLPMVENLLKAHHALTVFDVDSDAVEKAVARGALAAPSNQEASAGAEMVITMLPNGNIVRRVYEETGGLFDIVAPETLLIDCSTIASADAVALANKARERNLFMLDAPVSGGTRGAQDATLSFMVGGDTAAVKRARPILLAMGKAIFHLGANGSGQLAKICNNMMCAILMAGTAEVLALGVCNGLDPRMLTEIMRKSTGNNFALEHWNPWPGIDEGAPASRGFAGGFQVGLMIKDLGLAAEIARTGKAAIPIGATAQNVFQLHALGRTENSVLDMSSIQRLYYPGLTG